MCKVMVMSIWALETERERERETETERQTDRLGS